MITMTERLLQGALYVSGTQRDLMLDAAKRIHDVERALRTLRGEANRLCDRGLGGTYEEDCRRAIALADEVLS